ncbi:MAG: DUF58 domain-containing protein [Planctomycetes bacterium]|nr:DUF58 domain-containing protein [Planctomycetota bacterium]
MFDLHITWRGGIFLALTTSVGYAAVSKGNNYLFLTFCALAAIFLTSAALTLLLPRGLDLERALPDSVCATDPFSYTVQIRNRKRLLPAFCIQVEDRLLYEARPASPPIPSVPVPLIRAGQSLHVPVFATALHRGWAKFVSVTITAEFPPGLVRRRRVVPLEDRMLVYPRRGILDRHALDPLLARVDFTDLVSAGGRGNEEFAGVRDYRAGDSPRWIHWKLSARVPRRPVVKEFEDARARDAVILLETLIPNPSDSRRASRLERALSFGAALADTLLAEGYLVRFLAFGPEPLEIALEPHHGSSAELQRLLATLRPTRTHPIDALARESRGDACFLLRIGDEKAALPTSGERVIEIHADDMRSMMFYPR